MGHNPRYRGRWKRHTSRRLLNWHVKAFVETQNTDALIAKFVDHLQEIFGYGDNH